MEPNGPAFSRQCWEERRETIVRLYQAEDCDFKTLVEIMKSNGFVATRREYMKKLKQWGIHKNVKADEYAAIVRIQARRQAEGKQTSFRVRKRPVSRANISRYLRRSKKNESPRSAVDAPTPPFVEYGTPAASPSPPVATFDQDCERAPLALECLSAPDAAVGDSGQLSVDTKYATPKESDQWAPVAAQDVSGSPFSSALVSSPHRNDSSSVDRLSPVEFVHPRCLSSAPTSLAIPVRAQYLTRQESAPRPSVSMPETLRYAEDVLRSIREYIRGLRTASLCSCDEAAEGHALMPKTGAGAIHPRHCWLAEADPRAGRACSTNLVNGFLSMQEGRYAEGRALLQAGLAQYDECIRHCPYQARFLAIFLSIHARHASLHRAQAVVFDYVRRVLRRRLGAQWPDHPLVRIAHILYLATRYHASSVVHDPAVMLFLDDIYDSNSSSSSSSSSSDNIPAATTSVKSSTVGGGGGTAAGMSQVRRWEWTFFALRAHFDRVADCSATGDGSDGSSAIRSLRRKLAELQQGIAAEQNPPFDSLLKLLIFIAHKGPAEMHLEPLYVHLIQHPRSLDKIVSCVKELVGFLRGDWTDGRTRFHYLRALVIALWRFEHSYTMMADGEAAAVLRLWRLSLDAWLGDNKGKMEVQGHQPPSELRRLMDRPKGS